jgi:outer membrane receptor protein involved in Fe transport
VLCAQHRRWGSLTARLLWTRTLERSNFTNPTNPNFENRILGELGDPENQINFNADLKVGKVKFGYRGRWIDKMYLNTYEDFNTLQGRPPENADYAAVAQYPSVFYHDLRLDFDATENISVFGGIDNVTNKVPPYGLTGIGAGSGIYNSVGRYFYAGAKVKF